MRGASETRLPDKALLQSKLHEFDALAQSDAAETDRPAIPAKAATANPMRTTA